MLSGQAAAPTLFHFVGQLPHGLLCDSAPFATGDGSLSHVNGRQNFGARALALFPQGKSFLHRVFLTVETAAFNGLANKGLLVRGKMYFHTILSVGGGKASVNMRLTPPLCFLHANSGLSRR